MSNLVIPTFYGISDNPDHKGLNRFKPCGVKRYQSPQPLQKLKSRLAIAFAHSTFNAFKRIQVRVSGAGAHPTHPSMLMDVYEFRREEGHIGLFGEWIRVKDEDVTPFPEWIQLKEIENAMKTEEEKTIDNTDTPPAKEAPKADAPKEMSPEASDALAASSKTFEVIQAAEDVVAQAQPLPQSGGYVVGQIPILKLHTAILELKQQVQAHFAAEEEPETIPGPDGKPLAEVVASPEFR